MSISPETILSSRCNATAWEMAIKHESEFRVLVRDGTYSGAIASARKLKKPKKYPTGWQFAIRVRPKVKS